MGSRAPRQQESLLTRDAGLEAGTIVILGFLLTKKRLSCRLRSFLRMTRWDVDDVRLPAALVPPSRPPLSPRGSVSPLVDCVRNTFLGFGLKPSESNAPVTKGKHSRFLTGPSTPGSCVCALCVCQRVLRWGRLRAAYFVPIVSNAVERLDITQCTFVCQC